MNARSKRVAETGHGSPIDRRLMRVLRPSTSIAVFLALMSYVVLVRLLLSAFFPNAFADPAQAAPFAWPVLATLAVLGVIGAWLAERTGFPAAWDRSSSNRWHLLMPLVIGLT